MAEVTVLLHMQESDVEDMRRLGITEVRVVNVLHDGREGDDMPATVYRLGSLPEGPKPLCCPRCASKSPNLHPATQADGGEVSICPDPWHDDPITAKARAQVALVT